MYKEANILNDVKGLAKATSKLGTSSKNLSRAISNKDKARALKAGMHIGKGAILPGAAVAGLGAGAYLSGEKGKERRDKAKRIVTDNILPSMKAGMGQKALSAAGAGIGTAIGIKKGKSFADAAKTGGLAGLALGDTVGSVVVPQGRFIKMHKKEFGTMPSAKDMGKLFAVNTLPTAAFWGGVMSLKKPRQFYQNTTKDMVEGLGNKVKNLKGTKGRVKDAFAYAASPEAQKVNNQEFVKEYISKLKGPAAQKGNKNLVKTMGKAMLVDRIFDEAVDLPTKFVTPESLIRKKKENEAMNKNAFDIVNDTFEKIAEEEAVLDTKKRFVNDRLLPALGLGMSSYVGSNIGGKLGGKVGQTVGGLGATYAVTKAMQKNMEEKGYGKADSTDTAKTMLVNPFTMGLGFTPQTLAKDKLKRQLKQEK